MTPERDLSRLLAEMNPERRPGRFVFVDLGERQLAPAEALATVREAEGLSAVLTEEDAIRLGLSYDFVAGWITLRVESALQAVGLTAVVSTRLADQGISCNVVAGLHHDHLLVPAEEVDQAMRVLKEISSVSELSPGGKMSLPLGEQVSFESASPPLPVELLGTHVSLMPSREAEIEELFAISHTPNGDPAIWTYLPHGPFEDVEAMSAEMAELDAAEDSMFFTIFTLPERSPQGVASYLRISPETGSIEIGNIWFGPSLQRSSAATEAIYLLARYAFDDLGYRRLEWKCNALNARSRRAADRFGFTYEGVFRQQMVVKGRNRDTAWYSITDREWPGIRTGFEAWLDPGNFDEGGEQKRALGELIGESRR